MIKVEPKEHEGMW